MSSLPLNALRAFEVAARHASYTRAAEELRLTHSAISHQMRLLEDEVGVPLFAREGRQMRLTTAGAELAGEVREAFDRLTRAFERARRTSRAGTITVSVLPSLASRWLVPRLARFYQLHPDTDISLRCTDELANFKNDGVDLALRYGGGRWPGLTAIELMREEIFVVCSPAVQWRLHLKKPSDLARVTLLRNTNLPWVPWFRSVGLDWAEPSRGTLYDDTLTTLQAATEGHGVALARGVMAADDLATGRLARLFEGSITVDWAYYAVYPGSGEPPPHVAPFLSWLQSEAKGEHDRARGRDAAPTGAAAKRARRRGRKAGR